ncbi:hypothetical protein CLV24_13728 [Pontibacter ummariensis]|uniref:Uncharacterized protein n=1 Tax=Pontibacter ummariensis TaxID=1610492 RepID=A0A239L8Z8_9BACT|nr:hypothetical protein CLV24_13728 [Pontibacter ummariensis]SNT26760.1 hypothetical protein SAMN06296052_13729 [Pontibacter ummariensis]
MKRVLRLPKTDYVPLVFVVSVYYLGVCALS